MYILSCHFAFDFTCAIFGKGSGVLWELVFVKTLIFHVKKKKKKIESSFSESQLVFQTGFHKKPLLKKNKN